MPTAPFLTIDQVAERLQVDRRTVRTAGEHLIAAVYAMTLAAERAVTTTPIRPSTMADAVRRAK